MKHFLYIIGFLVFIVLFSSCASSAAINVDEEVAGYNLNSKKEQMHSKILHSKNKTVLATP